VPRLELGVTKRSDSLGRSAPLSPQTLECYVNSTKLSLQCYALGGLSRLYARLELFAVYLGFDGGGIARCTDTDHRSLSRCGERPKSIGDGSGELAEEGVRAG
jgi:hypothetical protein